jgi:hypothetical protein
MDKDKRPVNLRSDRAPGWAIKSGPRLRRLTVLFVPNDLAR